MRLFTRVVLFASIAIAAFAQTDRGNITGTVTDQGGAVVANATVRAKQAETGRVYEAQTTNTGNYTVPQLPYGTYEVSVEVTGFKRYAHANMLVQVAQTLREDVQLQVGASTESVTVTAEASLLKTESGELAHEVTVKQMQELPILSVGGGGSSATSGFRNPWSAALLIPGTQFNSNSSLSVNGSTTSYSIRVEGMDAQMDGASIIYTQRVQPSVDAIQEVAIQTSNFSAEFGNVGGGLFNVSMRSGGNAFHGNAYDYLVNEMLNASQPYSGKRSQQRRQDLGGTIGGPIIIPKIYNGKDKSFFFFSYEHFIENIAFRTPPAAVGGAVGVYPTVPIQDYRDGNFGQVITGSGVNGVPRPIQVSGRDYVDPLGRSALSGAIFDPTTERSVVCNTTLFPTASCTNGTSVLVRDAFPNNVIPKGRFDPTALALQTKYIPLPTITNLVGQNFNTPWRSERTSKLPSIKIDHQIGTKGHLSGYYQGTGTDSQYSSPNGNMEGFPTPITVARGTFIHSKVIRINYDHTLTPTLLAHVGIGFLQQKFDDHAPTTDFDGLKELGLKGATLARTFPQIITGATLATGGLSNLGPGAQGPSQELKPQGNLSVSWVKQNHTYKFGGEWRATGYPTYNLSNTSGIYPFGASATTQTALQNVTPSQGSLGFAYASFLLGYMTPTNGISTGTLSAPIAAKTGQQQLSLFAQDTWKVTRKLTLDYGLRWDYGTYSKEQYGRYGSVAFDLANPAASGRPGAAQYEATCNCSFAQNYPLAFGPRIGVAYQIAPKTVLRGGFGVVYGPVGVNNGSSTNSAAFGSVAFGGHLNTTFADAMTTLHPVWPGFDPASNATPGTIVAAPTYIDLNAGRPSRQYQWSIGLQREVGRNIVVEATYVANRAIWLSGGNGLAPYNAISQDLLAKYGFTDFNNASDATLLNATISTLNAAQQTSAAAHGINLRPYANFPVALTTVRQALLRFPQYNISTANAQVPTGAPLGNSWYDSLQATVTKRLSHGLSVNANFTWSKALTLLSSPDVFNRQLGKNLSAQDLPYQLRISADYLTPRIESTMPVLSNKAVSYALSGWGLGWYSSYQSAAILNRPASTGGPTSIDKFLGGRGPGPAQRVAGQPLYSTDWTDYDGKHHTDELDINCHCYDPTKTVVLNPKAWANVPDGQWGAEQTAIRNFRGYRYPQENANISRNFRFHEGKMNFQIRVEFQNIFNRTQLPQPVALATTNFASLPSQANGLYTGGFGTVLPASGTGNFRTGLFIGRFTF